MLPASAAAFQEMVDDVHKMISEAVFKLGQDLAGYGFTGIEVEATLVARTSSGSGIGDAEDTRKIKFDGFIR